MSGLVEGLGGGRVDDGEFVGDVVAGGVGDVEGDGDGGVSRKGSDIALAGSMERY